MACQGGPANSCPPLVLPEYSKFDNTHFLGLALHIPRMQQNVLKYDLADSLQEASFMAVCCVSQFEHKSMQITTNAATTYQKPMSFLMRQCPRKEKKGAA